SRVRRIRERQLDVLDLRPQPLSDQPECGPSVRAELSVDHEPEMSSRVLLAVFTFVAVSGCTRAEPEPPAPGTVERVQPATATSCDRAAVETLLSMPHDSPTREELEHACAEPTPVLVAFARDVSARGLIRLRAIESLGHFGGALALETA